MLDEPRKPREPSQSVIERRRSEAIVGSHLPTLAALQSEVAKLTAQAQHTLRVGDHPDSQLRQAEATLERIAKARAALSRAGNADDGRVTDVERSLTSLYRRAEKAKMLIIERRLQPPA